MEAWRSLMRQAFLMVAFCCALAQSHGQGFTRQTYHDPNKKNLKEIYQVKDTVRNILHGRYISYYLNGTIESKGQFTNNETTGVWEFFYETGNLRMRGILRQNSNYGKWEYFYESGQKNMEGNVTGKNREGEWRTYYENGQVKEVGEYRENKRVGLWKIFFEDGVLRGEIDYKEDLGNYKEYFHSGKTLAEGPKRGTRNLGRWKFYSEAGALQAEGDYQNGKKHGEWITYHANGKISSRGRYENDMPVGEWQNYFDTGEVSSSGEYKRGVKIGNWKTFNNNGVLKSDAQYNLGTGDYREYYLNGKLKAKGKIVNSKKEGRWEFYYEDGKLEGECNFKDDKGTYIGYYENGNLRTKGPLEGDQKTGTWELYENDGTLSGYYRPFYDDKKIENDIHSLSATGKNGKHVSSAHRLTYFDERFNEFKGVIIGGNPIFMFAGALPVSAEFYLQERLGNEVEFIGIRSPFFKADDKVPVGTHFRRGYAVTLRQKYYNQTKLGMWYFGQEIRFTSRGHFMNEVNPITESMFIAGAAEQRIEYGWLCGYRIMQRNYGEGMTIDAFISGNLGYRAFNVEDAYASYFDDINQSKFATSVHFGLNFGRVFSFR